MIATRSKSVAPPIAESDHGSDYRICKVCSVRRRGPSAKRGALSIDVIGPGQKEVDKLRNEWAKKLKKITEMGYRIAIDDFGTGYSNLSYISRFPLKCLKIDRSFVDRLPESGPIISLILTLARQIGATAVAEGVETQEQCDWLASQDCEQAQGYYLSRPVEPVDFLRVVEELNARRGATGGSC